MPKLDFFFTILPEHPDFFLDNTRYAAGVWTVANWTWFFAHIGEAVSPGALVLLVPLALAGWWRGFSENRAAVAAFVFVPLVPYSLIMGTRQIEYVGPSIVVLIACAVAGLATVRRVPIRATLTAALVVVGVSGIWQIVGERPLGSLERAPVVHRIAGALFAGGPGTILDRANVLGEPATNGRIANVLFAKGTERVAVLDLFPTPRIPYHARACLEPLIADRPAGVAVESVNDPARLGDQRWDVVLVAGGDGTGETVPPPTELTDHYREIARFPLYEGLAARVYFPNGASDR